jgi:hypothetical protein
MLKFSKYLLFIIGTLAFVDFLMALFNVQDIAMFTIIGLKVSKTIYLVYKFIIGILLVLFGLKVKINFKF